MVPTMGMKEKMAPTIALSFGLGPLPRHGSRVATERTQACITRLKKRRPRRHERAMELLDSRICWGVFLSIGMRVSLGVGVGVAVVGVV